jgi:predicted enzyme related to lactoylglutathione lyase
MVTDRPMPAFRFAYTTEAFPATVAFWQDAVGLNCLRNESLGSDPTDNRVAWFDAGSGAVIEVIESANVRPADGSWIALEVDDVDAMFSRLVESGVEVRHAPTTSARERSFYMREPNGIGVLFFSPIDNV